MRVSSPDLMNKMILTESSLFLFQQEIASNAFPFYSVVESSMASDFPKVLKRA